MEDTSGFYKYDKEYNFWLYAPNRVYSKSYTLNREGNREEVDGWKWYNTSPEEHISN